jgi:hypothetical protein
MKSTAKYLNDEHMRHYEWSGISRATPLAPAQAAKRSHAWHASYGVLAVLTTLLILNGCDRDTTAERSGDEQVEQTAQAPSEQPMYDESPAMSSPTEAGAPAGAESGDPAASGSMSNTAPGTDQSGGTIQP